MDPERRIGPLTARAWGLVLNFVCNALALYGLSLAVRDRGGTPLLVLGVVGTVACLGWLARPSH